MISAVRGDGSLNLGGRAVLAAAAFVVAAAIAYSSPAIAQAARPLELGIVDGQSLSADDPATRALWFDRAAAARANLVIIGVGWSGVARKEPAALTGTAVR